MRESPTHEHGAEATTAEAAHEADATTAKPHERYVAGAIPPVAAGAETANAEHAHAGQKDRTASELAFEDDDNVRELKTKVGGLVASRFAGDYKAAFKHYDADKDGGVDKAELGHLLSDAGVGNGLTRGTWASRIIEKLDGSGDGKIEWNEFESVFSASA